MPHLEIFMSLHNQDEHSQGSSSPGRIFLFTWLRELGKWAWTALAIWNPSGNQIRWRKIPYQGRAIPFAKMSSGTRARGPTHWILWVHASFSTSALLTWKNSERTRVYPFRMDEGRPVPSHSSQQSQWLFQNWPSSRRGRLDSICRWKQLYGLKKQKGWVCRCDFWRNNRGQGFAARNLYSESWTDCTDEGTGIVAQEESKCVHWLKIKFPNFAITWFHLE